VDNLRREQTQKEERRNAIKEVRMSEPAYSWFDDMTFGGLINLHFKERGKIMKETKREWARKQAAKIVSISIEEARKLPSMLGRIVPLQLELHGWYACQHAGVTTFYELA
jgi:hypothetical protein